MKAVVTGSTRGLGAALASYLEAQGWTVFGCGRATVDVSDFAQVSGWAAQVGPPDLLICNAGLTNRPAPLWEISPEEFSGLISVNVQGVYHTLRAFLPGMVTARRGLVVTISSDWGRSTSAWMAPYCASKFAVEGLTRALAQDLPEGMGAIALDPGTIDTEMLRTVFDDGARYYLKPSEWIEKAGPFILSLGSEHNGQSLRVPGLPED